MRRPNPAFLLAVALALPAVADAQKPAVYPAKGQSSSQQTKDDGECQGWANQQAGSQAAAPPAERRGGVARGAVAGAAIGGIADGDVGKAAATGAVVGGVHQANQRRRDQRAASDANSQNYWKAYSACMSGRGYTLS